MPSSNLTLAVSLAALEALERPGVALEDAATWSSHVGIVSAEPSFVERRRVREAGYPQDFLSGPRSIRAALTSLPDHFETDRYVFVGTDATKRVVDEVPDWTYRSVQDAATAAGWRLATASAADDERPC